MKTKTRPGLLGKKIGMTQVFDPNGSRVGVTAVEVGPCFVIQKRTTEKDGYTAIQVGFVDKPERVANRPEIGHFAKAGVAPKRYLHEFRVTEEVAAGFEVGQQIDIAGLFAVGDKLDVTGTSKGKGFTGVMRRHNFCGAKSTHGVHEAFRHGGSLGQNMTPGRVMKGKKMAGHQGDARVTVKNIVVVRVFPGDNMVFLEGPIPGSRNGLVELVHSAGR
jgi:large subunit ribosomal protein L3